MTLRYNSGDHDLGRDVTLRRDEFMRAQEAVRDGRSVLVSGGSKLGKTTLLRQLQQELLACRDALVVYFDLRTLDALRPELLWEALGESLERAAAEWFGPVHPSQSTGAPIVPTGAPFRRFASQVRELSKRLLTDPAQPRLVLLLDECERLLDFDKPNLPVGNLRSLTSLEDAPVRPQLVITGFRMLRDYEMPDGTSPFNTFDAVSLRPIVDVEARGGYGPLLAELPHPRSLGLKDWLNHETGGHPFVLQVLCAAVQRGIKSRGEDAWSDWGEIVGEDQQLQLMRTFAYWTKQLKLVSGAEGVLGDLVRGGPRPASSFNPRVVEFLAYSGLVLWRDGALSAPVGRFNRWWKAQQQETTVASREKAAPSPSRADVLIVNALRDEYDQVLRVEDGALDSQWFPMDGPNDYVASYRRYSGRDGAPLTVVATYADMTREQTQPIASLFVQHYKPRVLAMSGICAGRRGKVHLGDVIIGDRLWSVDGGKRTVERVDGQEKEVFEGDPHQYRLKRPWRQRAQDIKWGGVFAEAVWLSERPALTLERQGDWVLSLLSEGEMPKDHPKRPEYCPDWKACLERLWRRGLLIQDTVQLTEAGKSHVKQLRLLYPDDLETPPNFQVHIAPIGTGAAVEEDEALFPRLASNMRKVLGMEMEASALGALGEIVDVDVLVAKGVSDHADSDKDDRYRAFAARASAEVVITLLRQLLKGNAGEGTPA